MPSLALPNTWAWQGHALTLPREDDICWRWHTPLAEASQYNFNTEHTHIHGLYNKRQRSGMVNNVV